MDCLLLYFTVIRCLAWLFGGKYGNVLRHMHRALAIAKVLLRMEHRARRVGRGRRVGRQLCPLVDFVTDVWRVCYIEKAPEEAPGALIVY